MATRSATRQTWPQAAGSDPPATSTAAPVPRRASATAPGAPGSWECQQGTPRACASLTWARDTGSRLPLTTSRGERRPPAALAGGSGRPGGPRRPGTTAAKPAHPARSGGGPRAARRRAIDRRSSFVSASNTKMAGLGAVSTRGAGSTPLGTLTTATSACAVMIASTDDSRTGSTASPAYGERWSGSPSAYWMPPRVILPASGSAGTKNTSCTPVARAREASSAPTLPRSVESVFL